jgi:hypothetical protein
MSARVLPFDSREMLSKQLGDIAPALRKYRHLLQSRFVSAVKHSDQADMKDAGEELLAYDRWRSFELGRNESHEIGGSMECRQ